MKTIEDFEDSYRFYSICGENGESLAPAQICEENNFEITNLQKRIDKTHERLSGLGELVLSGNGKSRDIERFDLSVRMVVEDLLSKGVDVSLDRAIRTMDFYIELFFSPENTSYIGSLGKNDMLRFAVECALNPACMSNIQLRIGVGTHDSDSHLVRLPIYIDPVVDFLRKLTKFYGYREDLDIDEKLLPEVVVYSAANMVAKVNGLDRDIALRNRDYYFEVFDRYARSRVAANLADRISYRPDLPVVPENIARVIRLNAEALFKSKSGFKPVQRIIDTSKRYGSNPVDGLSYAVSHAIYSLDGIAELEVDTSIVEGDTLPYDRNIIMIGGNSEIEYWMIRKAVSPEGKYRRGQIIQSYSEYPPYTPSPRMIDQDMTLLDLSRAKNSEDFRNRLQEIRNTFRKDVTRVCEGCDDPVSYARFLFDVK